MTTFMAIVLLISNQVAVFLESKSDAEKQDLKIQVNHLSSNVFRLIAWMEVSLLLHMGCDEGFLPLMYWVRSAVFCFLMAFTFWLTFDYIHNKWTGKKWYYTSSGPLDSILSGFENRFKRLILKVSLVAVFAFTYFKYL